MGQLTECFGNAWLASAAQLMQLCMLVTVKLLRKSINGYYCLEWILGASIQTIQKMVSKTIKTVRNDKGNVKKAPKRPFLPFCIISIQYESIYLLFYRCFIVSHRIKMLLFWIQVNDSAHLSSVGFQVLTAT